MLWDIDPKSKIPIFEQLVSQVIFNIASGGLEVGALIPSVRDLGVQLRVHPNTVAKAYQELEKKGILTTRRGRGMEVAEDALKHCLEERQKRIRGRIREALREAVSSGLSGEDIRQLVDEELGRVNGRRRA